MKGRATSYLMTFIVLIVAAAGAWLILHIASPETVRTVNGPEVNYIPLQ